MSTAKGQTPQPSPHNAFETSPRDHQAAVSLAHALVQKPVLSSVVFVKNFEELEVLAKYIHLRPSEVGSWWPLCEAGLRTPSRGYKKVELKLQTTSTSRSFTVLFSFHSGAGDSWFLQGLHGQQPLCDWSISFYSQSDDFMNAAICSAVTRVF